jgi:hypothetical protein
VRAPLAFQRIEDAMTRIYEPFGHLPAHRVEKIEKIMGAVLVSGGILAVAAFIYFNFIF